MTAILCTKCGLTGHISSTNDLAQCLRAMKEKIGTGKIYDYKSDQDVGEYNRHENCDGAPDGGHTYSCKRIRDLEADLEDAHTELADLKKMVRAAFCIDRDKGAFEALKAVVKLR